MGQRRRHLSFSPSHIRGQLSPRGSSRPLLCRPGTVGRAPVFPRAARRKALESDSPEATDLPRRSAPLGLRGGARVMAAVRGAAAKTKRSARTAVARRSEGSWSLPAARRAPPGQRVALLPASRARGARSPGLTHLPPPSSPDPVPGPQPPSPAGARPCPGVCVSARRGAEPGGAGRRDPARHLPSSLSSTIISGAPCPAELGSAGRREPNPGALRWGCRSSGSKRALITRLSSS